MNLKSLLKALKLNESTISMVLGALVVLTIGFLVFNQFRGKQEEPQPTVTGGTNTEIPEEGKVPEDLPETYTVSAGDHLWSIAEQYYGSGYNWADIAEANNIETPDAIEVGQEFTLPDTPAKKITVVTGTAFGPAITGETYTVEAGDHLWSIAVRAYSDGYEWPKIAEANDIANPDYIEIGQTLTLPRAAIK